MLMLKGNMGIQNLKNRYKNEPPEHTEAKRIGRFTIIGILNTVIDFTVLGLLHLKIGLPLFFSNIISTTCAMIFSFLMNKHVVFHDQDLGWEGQAVKFLATTAFGLWVIQSGAIQILTGGIHIGATSIVWHLPVDIGLSTAHALGFGRIFSDAFMTTYGAKVYGILLSMVWNYLMYRNVVFTKKATPKTKVVTKTAKA